MKMLALPGGLLTLNECDRWLVLWCEADNTHQKTGTLDLYLHRLDELQVLTCLYLVIFQNKKNVMSILDSSSSDLVVSLCFQLYGYKSK